jgi:glycine oxidase
LTRVVNEGHRYLVPRLDGHLLVGSSEEEVGYQCETTESVIGGLREWAEELLPNLKEASVEQTWAGLRPATVDAFPYIGRVPGRRRTWIAAGHFRSGLHFSCATAVVIADLIEGQDPPFDIDPFRPGRG